MPNTYLSSRATWERLKIGGHQRRTDLGRTCSTPSTADWTTSRSSHGPESCTSRVKTTVFRETQPCIQWCGSRSIRIRIHLGQWIRIPIAVPEIKGNAIWQFFCNFIELDPNWIRINQILCIRIQSICIHITALSQVHYYVGSMVKNNNMKKTMSVM